MPALLRNIYRRDDEFASPKVDQANYYMMVSKGVSMEVDGRIMIAAMLTLLGVLSLFLSIRLFIAIHQRRTLAERRERTIHMVFALAENQQREQSHSGLDKNILESLPVFVYRRMDFKEAPECAVCLSDFEEDEEGRVLPNCSHSFHVDCIDIWFRNHSICPVCRKDAAPLPTPENPNLTDEGNQNNAETSVWVDSGAVSSPGLRGSPRR